MNTWKTAVRHLEAVIPVSEQGYSLYVSLVDGLELLEDLDADAGFDVRRTLTPELRVRDDVGGWAW